MSEARETRAITTNSGIPWPSLLWLGLAISYLAASASGYHGIVLAVVGLMIGALVANSVTASSRYVAGLITVLVVSSACLYWSDSLIFIAYMPPIAGFAFMVFFFSRTLGHGSEPLITRIARKEHPDLPPEIAQYTRTLTWAWSGCFLFLLAAALLLAPFLPLHSWSRWMQGLGVALPVTLFLGEYAYRHHRLREHRHAALPVLILNSIAVIKEAAVKPVSLRPDSLQRH